MLSGNISPLKSSFRILIIATSYVCVDCRIEKENDFVIGKKGRERGNKAGTRETLWFCRFVAMEIWPETDTYGVG